MNKSEMKETARGFLCAGFSTIGFIMMVFFLTGCATTVTTGFVDPETRNMKFKSATTAVGNSAIENSKSIEFLVEDGAGFHIEASGNANTNATSQLTPEQLQALVGIITTLVP